jgi:hypothetical protein
MFILVSCPYSWVRRDLGTLRAPDPVGFLPRLVAITRRSIVGQAMRRRMSNNSRMLSDCKHDRG